MKNYGTTRTMDGKVITLLQDAYLDNNQHGEATYYAAGLLGGKKVMVEWAVTGDDYDESNNASWDNCTDYKML